MPELMLRPEWPNRFRRTVKAGRKAKTLVFLPGQPLEVSDEELAQLGDDVGRAVFRVERDEKGRPRFVEEAQEQAQEEPASV